MYIRPTYGEVRLMTAEQKKIHMKNMQKLIDEQDFIKYGINYKHQKDYQKKETVKNRLKEKYHKNKIDTYNEKLDIHIEKVKLLINKLFDISAQNYKIRKLSENI